MKHGIGWVRNGAAVAALCLAGVAAIPARSAADLPYLYEQLKKPAYKASLTALLRGQAKLPPWVGAFLKTSNGVATPGAAVPVGGQTLELYAVCEPHNCGGNFLYVLYAPGGGQAWALVTKDGQVIAMLGNPDPAHQKALTDAMKP